MGVTSRILRRPVFIAAEGASRAEVHRASLWLLGATALAVLVALTFRGNRTWAAVIPVIALAVLQRFLRSRPRSRATVDGEALPSSAPLVPAQVTGWLERLP